MTRSIDELYDWIDQEVINMWYDFVLASQRAARPPDPNNRASWSSEMFGLYERIIEVDDLLGHSVSWKNLSYDAFPYWPAIEGTPLPQEAWAWLDDVLNEHRLLGYDMGPIQRNVLAYRPVAEENL